MKKKRQKDIKKWMRKKALYKLICESRIRQNQRSIIRLSKSTQNIALRPVPAGFANGRIERYYHFVFDLLLPLSFLIKKTPSNCVFILTDFGILSPVFLNLFAGRVRISPHFDELPKGEVVDLIGMNPKEINIHRFQFRNLEEVICANLNINSTGKKNKILLIERAPPVSYYLNDAEKKGAGTSRRSIKNQEELKKYISSIIASNYEFHNLILEEASFEDQVKYFSSAVIVIAQHGAGLANILWMPEESIVIEFGFNSRDHFKRLSSSMKHHHFSFDYDEAHIEVNCSALHRWLLANEITRGFFKKRDTLHKAELEQI